MSAGGASKGGDAGYTAEHFETLSWIAALTPGSNEHLSALASLRAAVVRRDTVSSGSSQTFAERLRSLSVIDGDLCYMKEGMPLRLLPLEMWPLVRALAMLSPSSDYGAGRSLAHRTDKAALAELKTICAAAGWGAKPPFGFISSSSLTFIEALRTALDRWLECLDSPARCYLDLLPRELSLPVHDGMHTASFLAGTRPSLLILCGQGGRAGRAFCRALAAHAKRRMNLARVVLHFDGKLATFTFVCCRSGAPSADSAAAAAAGSAADAGAGEDAPSLDGKRVAARLAAAVRGVNDDGKKPMIGLGCPASWKLTCGIDAPLWLLTQGEPHDHDALADDVFLPLPPDSLAAVYNAATQSREALLLSTVITAVCAQHVINDARTQALLASGATDAEKEDASPLPYAGASSADRYVTCGLGPAPPTPAAIAAAAAAAMGGLVEKKTCYCRRPLSSRESDEMLVACDGAACSLGGAFCLECVPPQYRYAAESGEPLPFKCSACKSASAAAALVDAQELEGAEDDTGALGTAAAADAASAAASSAAELSAAAAAAARSPLAHACGVFGAPRVLTAYRRLVRSEDMDNYMSQLRLRLRGRRTVTADTFAVLEEMAREGPGAGHFVEFVHKKDASGVVVSFRFSWATSEMRANAVKHGLTEFVIGRDFTAGTNTLLNCDLGADVGVASDAYGKSATVANHLIISEPGVDGSWTEHLVGAARFLTRVMKLPEPVVQFTDKDPAAIKAWLILQQERMCSVEAVADLERVLRDLDGLGAAAPTSAFDAARRFVERMPSFVDTPSAPSGGGARAPPAASAAAADGDDRSTLRLPLADAVAPSMAELVASISPSVLPPLSLEMAAAAADIFAPGFLVEYAALATGLALHAVADLRRCVSALKAAESGGEWNETAVQLLWLRPLVKEGSALEVYLKTYVFRFTLLCDFHTAQALERAFKKDGIVPMRILKAFTALVNSLFREEIDYVEFKRLARPLLEESGAPLVRAGGGDEYAVYAYLEKNWLCVRYNSLVRKGFRALLARLFIDTTNIVEGTWSVLKVHHLRFFAYRTVRALISRLTGLPLPGDAATESRRDSIAGQRILEMDGIANGSMRRSGGYKIDVVLGKIALLSTRAAASAASGSSILEYDPAFGSNAPAIGAYRFGNSGAGLAGWTHKSAAAPAGWPPAVDFMTPAQRSHFPTVAEAKGRPDEPLDTHTRISFCNRSPRAVAAAVAAAMRAASSPAAGSAAVRRLHLRQTPAERIAELLRSSRAGVIEYTALAGRRLVERVAAMLTASAPESLLSALEPLFTAPAPDALALAAANQAARRLFAAHAWPPLNRADFGGDAPKVAEVYLFMATMPAREWHSEGHRVLVLGETLSKMSHRPLLFNFKVVLADMMPLAIALCEAGRGAEMLTLKYIGQELRAAGCIGERLGEHMGRGGNGNIREIACRTAVRGSEGRIVTPLSSVVIIEQCLLAIVQPSKAAVDFAEDALTCLASLLPGVVLANSSPGSCNGRRFLDWMPEGPPLLHSALAALLAEDGKNGVNLATRLPSDSVPRFLGRALSAAAWLMRAGRFVDDSGMPTQPALSLGAAADAPRDFSQLQCAGALLAGDHHPVLRVQLLFNACSCSYLGPVCPCILAIRIIHRHNGLPRLWGDKELELCGFDRPRTLPHSSAAAAGAAGAGESSDGALHIRKTPRDFRVESSASLLALLALAPDMSDPEAEATARTLQKMAANLLQKQRERIVAGGAGHGAVHLSDARAQTSAEIDERRGRQRITFAAPADAISCLHAALELTAAGFQQPMPPPLPASTAASGLAAALLPAGVVSAALATAAVAVTRIQALAATAAVGAATAAAEGHARGGSAAAGAAEASEPAAVSADGASSVSGVKRARATEPTDPPSPGASSAI